MRKILLLCLVFSLAVLFIPGCGKQKAPWGGKPFYTVKKVAKGPAVDGILNDECWKSAPAIDFSVCVSGEKPKHPTSLRLLYDGKYLYAGFECQDLDAASTVTAFDGPVTEQDHVSLYLDAGSDTTGYFVIDVSPTGAVHDAFVLHGGGNAANKVLSCWNCEKLRASVSVYGGGAQPGTQDRFWTVEIAIPLSELVTAPQYPPEKGDRWRADFFRTELSDGQELSAAVPTGANDFHIPRRFGVITFGE
ncbi:MAG: carbohydrate-binding family 9-like protein [Candidatus Latescibacter sp.]|nr:carbohydrate-binding family 9-like protein [Candidatus Latescibacter sp.]